MPLCSACSEIDLKALVAAAYERHTTSKVAPGEEELSPSIPSYKHLKTRFEIRDNAALCDCCEVLAGLIPKDEPDADPGRSGEVLIYVLFSGYLDLDKKTSLVLQLGSDEELWGGWRSLYKCISDDPIEKFLEPILPTNSGSPKCMLQAKKWLMDCEANHPDCHRAEGNLYPLPTRVLRVGDVHTHPSLYVTEGEKANWVALSYVWGSGQKLVLNQEREAELLQGMPLNSFPATIRDAILVARGLGIQYIWVDALCIKQGDKADWDREAPKMGQVYSHAVLTIINGEADSTNSGIFSDRSELGNARCSGPTCTLPWGRSKSYVAVDIELQPETENIIVNRVQRNPSSYAGPGADRHKWSTRGWTLQEELLSWRTLTFMKKEILWSCPSVQVWESGQSRMATADYSRDRGTEPTRRVNPNLGLIKLSQLQEQSTDRSLEQAGLLTLTTPGIYRAWYSMVEEYSKRNLTNDTDKLMAISGMARNVHAYITDRYCAGLWDNDLVAGLIWDYDNDSWSHYDKPFEANSDPGIPSWSWASINGEVFFRYKEQALRAKICEADKFVKVAQIDELKIKHVCMDKYGPVSRCKLVITGPSYSCFIARDEPDQPELQNILVKELLYSPEYKARHKHLPIQRTIFLQLAWTEGFITQYAPEEKRYYFPACAVLVVETVDGQELDTPSDNTNETYRRVSLLHFGDVRTDLTIFKQPAWPLQSITVI